MNNLLIGFVERLKQDPLLITETTDNIYIGLWKYVNLDDNIVIPMGLTYIHRQWETYISEILEERRNDHVLYYPNLTSYFNDLNLDKYAAERLKLIIKCQL